MDKVKLNAEQVIALIGEYKGNLAHVARSLRVSRPTLYKFVKSKPTVAEALQDARETMTDNVESALYTAALNGEAWAVCFYLKTQAKDRGYVERQEVTGADGPIELVVRYVNKENKQTND